MKRETGIRSPFFVSEYVNTTPLHDFLCNS